MHDNIIKLRMDIAYCGKAENDDINLCMFEYCNLYVNDIKNVLGLHSLLKKVIEKMHLFFRVLLNDLVYLFKKNA